MRRNRIRRHEHTRPDKENDRVRNIDSLNAQTGPVLLAYRANAELRTLVHTAASGAPLMSTTGPNETRHTIWRVAEPELVAEIGAAFDAARRAVHRGRTPPFGRGAAGRGSAPRGRQAADPQARRARSLRAHVADLGTRRSRATSRSSRSRFRTTRCTSSLTTASCAT